MVEDEARLANALRRGLVADGFAVEVAHDGTTGFELVRTGGLETMLL